jgi:hypothetical protein
MERVFKRDISIIIGLRNIAERPEAENGQGAITRYLSAYDADPPV